MENENLVGSLKDFMEALFQVKDTADEILRKEVSSKFHTVLSELYDAIAEKKISEGL